MSHLVDFTRRLLEEGSVRLRQPPRLGREESAPVVDLLQSAYQQALLEVAGPALPFSPSVALHALQYLAWSCWFLLHRGEPSAAVESSLVPLPAARSAADHLSADLLLRQLPIVHRRARAVNPDDVLALEIEKTLRHWPLSGVLADIEAPPAVAVEFSGHHGLLLLFAERLARHRRPAWLVDGPAREYIELVFAQRQLPLLGD